TVLDERGNELRVGEAQTATEVFQLRLASAELGQAILANNFIGTALTQDQVSHYIPRTNRCYVELTVQTGDVSKNLVDKQHYTTTLDNAGWDDARADIDAMISDDGQ